MLAQTRPNGTPVVIHGPGEAQSVRRAVGLGTGEALGEGRRGGERELAARVQREGHQPASRIVTA